MRLSEAMMLGSTTCRMIAGDINSCALGAALNAVGFPAIDHNVGGSYARYDELRRLWPWLERGGYRDSHFAMCSGLSAIYDMFDWQVCRGKMTFEQLVDYVRSIEPDETDEQFMQQQEQPAIFQEVITA